MLVLFETAAGYAVFKLLNENKLTEVQNLFADFESPERASRILKLQHFQKFTDTTEALSAATAAIEGKVSKTLKKVLQNLIDKEVQDQLAVADAKLGNVIKEKFNLKCVSNPAIQELMRCIRSQTDSLISGLPQKDLTAMTLGLSHSLSRYKLKFSPDKVDTMIIQSINLLDDLDKELNNYIMRCREWYGWHFPELGRLITDNLSYVKVIRLMGSRENAADMDFSDILPEDVEEKVKETAEISMGTEITEDDIVNINSLCDQIVSMNNYRCQLYDYLKARMMAVAPNLTVLVGEVVGSRLISKAGSLINLAKYPASTVQLLGAEKALFRALKTKKDTPKYGLIYHTQLIGQTSVRNKGKMSRMLAAKAALATRVDALGETTSFNLGAEHKAKLEAHLRVLEDGNIKRISGTGKVKAAFEKYQSKSVVKNYPVAADSTLKLKQEKGETSQTATDKTLGKRKLQGTETDDTKPSIAVEDDQQPIPKKKNKKSKHRDSEALTTSQVTTENDDKEIAAESSNSEKKKKKKKKKKDTDDTC